MEPQGDLSLQPYENLFFYYAGEHRVMLEVLFPFCSLIDNCPKFRSNLGFIRYISATGPVAN